MSLDAGQFDDRYKQLWDDVAWLHLVWDVCGKLFGEQDRVDLLNGVARGFFRQVQGIFYDHIILQIARLTDKAKTFQQENLTLERLVQDCGSPQHLVDALGKVKSACAPPRRIRNKRLVHLDLGVAAQAKKFPTATRDEVDAALQAIRDFWDTLDKEGGRSPTVFTRIVGRREDAEALIHRLEWLRTLCGREMSFCWKCGHSLANAIGTRCPECKRHVRPPIPDFLASADT